VVKRFQKRKTYIDEPKIMAEKITVIYIISDRRSGSTLLENMLSKSEEVVSVGELAMLKGHIIKQGPGEIWNWNCSCGQPVMQCEFWSRVLKNIYDEKFETKINWKYKSAKNLVISALPSFSKKNLQKMISTGQNKQTIENINAVYISVSKISNKKFIVDSSKDPLQALAVNECENVNAKFIWLSRDLRAITFSKLKRWQINKRSNKKPLETLTDSFYYKRICAAVFHSLNKQNSLKISYEALAVNPQAELDKICSKFYLQPYNAPEFMELSNDHTVAGTPGRFERKEISADNSWKQFYKNKKALNILGSVFNSL
jgi:hypothetical protein